MNKIEEMLLEQMQEEKFQQTVSDDFALVDSLIDQSDLDKISNKEDNE